LFKRPNMLCLKGRSFEVGKLVTYRLCTGGAFNHEKKKVIRLAVVTPYLLSVREGISPKQVAIKRMGSWWFCLWMWSNL